MEKAPICVAAPPETDAPKARTLAQGSKLGSTVPALQNGLSVSQDEELFFPPAKTEAGANQVVHGDPDCPAAAPPTVRSREGSPEGKAPLLSATELEPAD